MKNIVKKIDFGEAGPTKTPLPVLSTINGHPFLRFFDLQFAPGLTLTANYPGHRVRGCATNTPEKAEKRCPVIIEFTGIY